CRRLRCLSSCCFSSKARLMRSCNWVWRASHWRRARRRPRILRCNSHISVACCSQSVQEQELGPRLMVPTPSRLLELLLLDTGDLDMTPLSRSSRCCFSMLFVLRLEESGHCESANEHGAEDELEES